MKETHKKSTLRIIGAILSIVGSILSLCFLMIDVVLGSYTSSEYADFAQDLINNSVYRMGLVLLIIILSTICISLPKPSKTFSIILLVVASITVFFPFLVENGGSAFGGIFGSVLLVIALIGAVAMVVDSFVNRIV